MNTRNKVVLLITATVFIGLFFALKDKSLDPKIPECYLGRCPVYQSMDVDGDNSSSESVVIVPTAMTKGAGKLIVIKQGKIIFESDELPGIGVKERADHNGLILTYFEIGTDGISGVKKEIKYYFKYGAMTL